MLFSQSIRFSVDTQHLTLSFCQCNMFLLHLEENGGWVTMMMIMIMIMVTTNNCPKRIDVYHMIITVMDPSFVLGGYYVPVDTVVTFSMDAVSTIRALCLPHTYFHKDALLVSIDRNDRINLF